MIRRIHHIGIAVARLDEGAAVSAALLGLDKESEDVVASQGVRVAFYPCGDTRVELLEPTADDGPVASFLAKRGPGVHHVAFEVDDIVAELERLRAAGVRLIDPKPRTGAHGNQVAFLHPRSTGGVLMELVQPAAED